MLWPCATCEKERPGKAYGVTTDKTHRFKEHCRTRLLEPGEWRQCVDCKDACRRASISAVSTRPVRAVLVCTGPCGKEVPESGFDPELLAMWRRRRKLGTEATCMACHRLRRGKFGKVSVVSRESVHCCRCRQNLERKLFDAGSLEQLQRDDSLHEAVCLQCAPIHREHLRYETYTCNICHESKPLTAFSLNRQKSRNFQQWRCEACERPVCRVCGRRPDKPLTYHWDGGQYRCLTCSYPPCTGCGKTRRREEKYHVDNMSAWRCPACKKASPR